MTSKSIPSDNEDIPEIRFPTSYDNILERIEQINPLKYARTRNFIQGAVTYLSPYISRGIISLKQVQESVLSKGYPYAETEKLLQELAWREYFQRVWQAKGEGIWKDLKQAQPDTAHYEMVAALPSATTGIRAIDQQIGQLYATGYMHNHTRMYLASLACNIARAYWREPSRWLYYHLLDGDIASNNCSWQWVAGAFASKKYYCNQENINKYTGSQQRHSYMDKSYEEIPSMPVPDELKETSSLRLTTVLPSTPMPVIDTSQPSFLYNAYNIDPLWRKGEPANRILLLEPSHYKQYPVSEKVIDFIGKLAGNIAGIQVYCGEVSDIQSLYGESKSEADEYLVSKEHPAFVHYPGIKDSRDWIYPRVEGYYPSFFAYWRQCERHLKTG